MLKNRCRHAELLAYFHFCLCSLEQNLPRLGLLSLRDINDGRYDDVAGSHHDAIEAHLDGELGRHRAAARKRALASLVGAGGGGRPQRSELIVRLDQLRDYHLLHQEGIDAVSFPVSRAALHQLPALQRKLRGREARIIWRLPFIIFEAEIPFYRDAATHLAEQGFRRFEAANLAHFPLLKGLDVEICTDYRLFSLNSQALLAWQELGSAGCTLYIEDDAENMGQLLAADVAIPRRVLVYGSIPVLTTKITIRDVKGDAPLVSDRGDSYRTAIRDGLTVVTPTRAFSLTGQRRRLQEMGCGSFILDLSQLSAGEWPTVIDAFNRGNPLPDTTEFNFQTGLV